MTGQGLFCLVCADCGGPLEARADGAAVCTVCQHRFLPRLGHLIRRPDPPLPGRPNRGIEMRIAQIAPLYEAVPPEHLRRHRAGDRRRCATGWSARGHDVMLFAADSSTTAAHARGAGARPAHAHEPSRSWPRSPPTCTSACSRTSTTGLTSSTSSTRTSTSGRFPSHSALPTPSVLTMHGRLDLDQVRQSLPLYPDMPLVSISDSQRPATAAPATSVGGHRLQRPGPLVPTRQTDVPRADHLAFVGRISPEKGPTSPSRSPVAPAGPARSPPRSIRSTSSTTKRSSSRSSATT